MFTHLLDTSHLPLLQYYYAFPTTFGSFNCPVCIPFRIYGGFGFLSSSICFESLATDRDSLFVFTAFALFSFSKLLSLSLHPSGTIDPNRFWETCEQLATFLPISISTGLSIDKLSPATCRKSQPI